MRVQRLGFCRELGGLLAVVALALAEIVDGRLFPLTCACFSLNASIFSSDFLFSAALSFRALRASSIALRASSFVISNTYLILFQALAP